MKKVTMQDIANKAGVSKTTVSIVLNNMGEKKKIRKETIQKIWDIAKELNFRPSFIAKSLKYKKSHTIGFLSADISNPFYAKIGRIIEDLAWHNGYQVLFGSTDESEEKEEILIDDLVNRQIDGLIIASSNPESHFIKNLIENDFPLVLMDRDNTKLKVNSVLINNQVMMQKAVERLIRIGKRRIGLLSLTPDIYTLRLRIEGYKDALKSHKMKIDRKLILTIDHKEIAKSTHKRLDELIDRNVDSIVFTNNQVASEAFTYIRTKYYPLLSKLDYITFDNNPLFDYIPSNITSIAQPINEIATKSIELLFYNMNGGKRKEKVLLDGKMIVRDNNIAPVRQFEPE